MKNSIVLTLVTAVALAFVAGCGSTKPRTTPLGDGTAGTGGSSSAPNLNTDPLGGRNGGVGVPVPGDLPDNEKLSGRPQDRTMFAPETVYFELDHHNVRAAEADKVGKVAARFKSLAPGHDLLVEGHCDERGTEGYNQALGEKRALNLRELLIKDGIDPQRVFTKSLGKDQPASLGHTEAAYSKNRRGEFILVLPRK
jgi:peptidoglycan-associated lipoprotein